MTCIFGFGGSRRCRHSQSVHELSRNRITQHPDTAGNAWRGGASRLVPAAPPSTHWRHTSRSGSHTPCAQPAHSQLHLPPDVSRSALHSSTPRAAARARDSRAQSLAPAPLARRRRTRRYPHRRTSVASHSRWKLRRLIAKLPRRPRTGAALLITCLSCRRTFRRAGRGTWRR